MTIFEDTNAFILFNIFNMLWTLFPNKCPFFQSFLMIKEHDAFTICSQRFTFLQGTTSS